ncbi:MAG: hypothetical protein JSS70_03065 [Bacteroidetes bacterium]|nr:hypothetical protein [Bacteroidota bacterium]
MKAIFICLLTGILLSVASFSQTDTSVIKKYSSLNKSHHFNNPFYRLAKADPTPPVSFSFRRESQLFVSPHSSYQFVRYSSSPVNTPLWKELISTAGKIIISTYEDNHNLMHFYPR